MITPVLRLADACVQLKWCCTTSAAFPVMGTPAAPLVRDAPAIWETHYCLA
jgi:hypothetical protein